MNSIDEQALKAKYDGTAMEMLLQRKQHFILHSVYRVIHRFVSIHDDEYSIALDAFSEAITSYDSAKGPFLPFASLIIRRRLIDYLKSNRHRNHEIAVDPFLLTGERTVENDDDGASQRIPIPITTEDRTLHWEILCLKDALEAAGITFSDLEGSSPKAAKTKRACAQAIVHILKNPLLLSQVQSQRMLPLKQIETDLKIPRKMLEPHRKYIIAAVEIMIGDYPLLAEYLGPVKEEMVR